jgi:hypothetical protein
LKYPIEFKTTGALSALYMTWGNMHGRCAPRGWYEERYNARYANRGISVCEEWNYWPTFAAWALSHGWRVGLEIDRRDNDGGYCSSNCRFVTDLEQNRNRDLSLAHRGIRAGQTRRWAKPFKCVETGVVFQTQIEAHRRHGVDRKSLRLALSGKYQQAGGFHWAYLQEAS